MAGHHPDRLGLVIVNSWSTRCGRNSELDRNVPASAEIKIIDNEGELDPTTGLYDFDPGTPVAITLLNPVTDLETTVYRGSVSRFTYDLYQNNRYAVATVECVDGLDRLARMEMYANPGSLLEWGQISAISGPQDGDVWFDQDDTGNAVASRINLVLDQAGWPSGLREIFSGNVKLQEVVYAYRTPAISPILDAADAEFPGVANFYCQSIGANAGKATFHGRLARFRPNDVQYHITTFDAGDLNTSGALIFDLTYDRDVNRIINSAIATPRGIADADIAAQRAEDSASISQYGVRSESFDNLLTNGDHFDGSDANEATKKIADYYVANYKDPRTRVNTVTFRGLPPTHPRAADTWNLICSIDISDIIALETNHWAGGFNEEFYVEGVRRRKGPHELDVEVICDLSPTAYYATDTSG